MSNSLFLLVKSYVTRETPYRADLNVEIVWQRKDYLVAERI